MKFGLIIIGDEIMSGKRQDKHFQHALDVFNARGLSLDWVNYLGDDRDLLIQYFKHALHSGATVFSCGGIGATPDDHTRQAVAATLGVKLTLHPEAKRLITERCAERGEHDMTTPENLQRLKMGELPDGADIIANPYNKIPGFSVAGNAQGRIYCLPGFPVMAWPMMEAVLDTHFAHLFHSQINVSQSMLVYGLPESAITPLMETVEQQYAPVRAFSLPSVGEDGQKPHIELGCKASSSEGDKVSQAFEYMRQQVSMLGGQFNA